MRATKIPLQYSTPRDMYSTQQCHVARNIIAQHVHLAKDNILVTTRDDHLMGATQGLLYIM